MTDNVFAPFNAGGLVKNIVKVCTAFLAAGIGLVSLPSHAAAPLVSGASVQQIDGKRVLRIQLSKDPAEREKQLAFGREQQSKVGKSNSQHGNGMVRPMWGDCGGFFSTWDECNAWDTIEYWRDSYYGAHQILETVVIKGKRKEGCTVAVSSEFGDGYASCADLKSLVTVPGSEEVLSPYGQELEVRGIKDAVLDGVDDLVAEVIKPLPKCAKTSPTSSIDTPDKDKDVGYFAAKESILNTFAGNLDSLRTGDLIDVQYPTGSVVRFVMMSWNVEDTDFWIKKYFDGKPNPKNTPCK